MYVLIRVQNVLQNFFLHFRHIGPCEKPLFLCLIFELVFKPVQFMKMFNVVQGRVKKIKNKEKEKVAHTGSAVITAALLKSWDLYK